MLTKIVLLVKIVIYARNAAIMSDGKYFVILLLNSMLTFSFHIALQKRLSNAGYKSMVMEPATTDA